MELIYTPMEFNIEMSRIAREKRGIRPAFVNYLENE